MSERGYRGTAGRTDGPDGRTRSGGVGGGTTDDGPGEDGAGPVLARFDRPRSPGRTSVAVVSDPHCSTRQTGTWKCYHRTERRLRTAIDGCNDRGVDAVVFAGDLTAEGRTRDFDAVHDALAGLSAPAFAVPGNHDVPKPWNDHDVPTVAAFGRRFAPDGLPFHADVGGLDVVGIDTATAPDGSLAEGHAGRASADQLAWLDEVLPRLDEPVVVGHHNLSSELPSVPGATARATFPLEDATALLETLALHDVSLYCSGHLHVPAVAERAGVRELVVPPLSSFPQGHLRLEVGPGGTTVRFVPVAGPAGVEESYLAARKASARTEAVAEATAAQLGRLPLRDETDPGVGAD
jgi:predicted phosphodiesterase